MKDFSLCEGELMDSVWVTYGIGYTRLAKAFQVPIALKPSAESPVLDAPADGSCSLLFSLPTISVSGLYHLSPPRAIREWRIRVINGLLSSLYSTAVALKRILALVSYGKIIHLKYQQNMTQALYSTPLGINIFLTDMKIRKTNASTLVTQSEH